MENCNKNVLDTVDHCDSGGRNELESEHKEPMEQISKTVPLLDTKPSGNQVTECNMHLLANTADNFLYQSPKSQSENNDDKNTKNIITAEPSFQRESNFPYKTNVESYLPNKPVSSFNPSNLADSTVQDLNLVSASLRSLNYPTGSLNDNQVVSMSASSANSSISLVNTVSGPVPVSTNQQYLTSQSAFSGNLNRPSNKLLPISSLLSPSQSLNVNLSSSSSLQQSPASSRSTGSPIEISPYITQTPLLTSASDILAAHDIHLTIPRTSGVISTPSIFYNPQVQPVSQLPLSNPSDNTTSTSNNPLPAISSDGNGIHSQNSYQQQQQHMGLSSISTSNPFQATSLSNYPNTTASYSGVYVSNDHTTITTTTNNNNNIGPNLPSLTMNPDTLELPSISSSSVLSNFNNLKPDQSDATIDSSFMKQSSTVAYLHSTSMSAHNECSESSTMTPTSSLLSDIDATAHDDLYPSVSKPEGKDFIVVPSESTLSCNKDVILSKSDVTPIQSPHLTSDSNRTLSQESIMVVSTSGEKATVLVGDNTQPFPSIANVNLPSTTDVKSVSHNNTTTTAGKTVALAPVSKAEESSASIEKDPQLPSSCNESSMSKDKMTSSNDTTTTSAGNVSSSSENKIIEESSLSGDVLLTSTTKSLSTDDQSTSADNNSGVALPELDSNKSQHEVSSGDAPVPLPSTSEATCLDKVAHVEGRDSPQRISQSTELNVIKDINVEKESKNNSQFQTNINNNNSNNNNNDDVNINSVVECSNSCESVKQNEAVQNTTVSASNSSHESDNKSQGIMSSKENSEDDKKNDNQLSVDNINDPVNAVSSSNSSNQNPTIKETDSNPTESKTCSSTEICLDQAVAEDDKVQSKTASLKENIKVELSDGSQLDISNDGVSAETKTKDDSMEVDVEKETSSLVGNKVGLQQQIKQEFIAEDFTTPNTDSSSMVSTVESNYNNTTPNEGYNDKSIMSSSDGKRDSSSMTQSDWDTPIRTVGYSLTEPRRSQRQPKIKFNVLDLIGSGSDIEFEGKAAKSLVKRLSNADSSGEISTEDMLKLASNISAASMTTSSPAAKKYKEADAEKLFAPFEQGWRREVVIRSVYKEFTKSGKPKPAPADIYYYTPENKKLRSMVQIVNYLAERETSLTAENFNFLRRPIYKTPFEMVRTAGTHRARHDDSEKTSKKSSHKKSHGANDSMSSVGDADIQLIEEPMFNESLQLETKINVKKHSKWKSPPSKRRSEETSSSEIPPKKIKSVARKSTSLISKSMLANMNKRNSFQPCSLNCPGLTGIPPQLHCDVCMCLFHNSCVNLKENEVPQNFKCKNCEREQGGWMSDVDTTASNSLSGNRTLKMNQSSWSTEKGRKSGMSSVIQLCKDTKYSSQTQKSSSKSSKNTSNGPPKYVVMNIVKSSLSGQSITDSLSSEPSQPYYLNDIESTSDILDCKSRLKSNKSNNSLNPSKSLSQTLSSISHSLSSPLSKDSIGETSTPTTFTLINSPSTSVNSFIQTTKDLNASTSSSSDCPVLVSSPKSSLTSGHSQQPNISSANVKLEVPSSSSTISSNVGDSGDSGKDNYPRSGQLLTLPLAVAKRLDSSLPLALRINNMQLFIPPSRCINTPEGLKVFLPPKTFSVPSGSTTTMNITFSSGTMSGDSTKDYAVSLSEKNKSSESNQVVDQNKSSESAKTSGKIPNCRNKITNYLCPFKRLYSGYTSMLQIFHYLSAGDLVRCSLVCKSWHQIATQPSLWKSIYLNNTRISNWTYATKHFSKFAVEELSLQGMKLGDDWNRIWHQLTPVLDQLSTIKRIYFDHVPALMLYTVCEKLPNLQELTAKKISDISNEQQWTTPTKIDLTKFCSVKMLKKLQLRGTGGLIASFPSGIFELIKLKYLRHLSITSLKASDHDFDYLGELRSLKVLELGECTNWTSETYFQLGKLVNLERLRLELGGSLNDVSLAKALGNLKCLKQLELMLFVISDELHTNISLLSNLSKLVIWPDTTHQPAMINSNTFALVTKLKNLKFLEWGVVQNKISESQTVTDIEMNSYGKSSQDNSELIPFQSQDDQCFSNLNNNFSNDNSIVQINIRQLNDKLKAKLPQTKISVLQSSDSFTSVIE